MDFVERPSGSFRQSAFNRIGAVSLLCTAWWSIAILATTLHGAAPAAQGRFNNPGPSGPIPCQAGCHPMFSNWLYCVARPIVCEFETQPDTTYQVFIGLTEVHWDRAGHRVVDLEVAGQTVATVDTFPKAQATPHGYVFRGASDAEGRFTIRIRPHPGSPDQNPVVCGVLLYAGDAALDVNAIIHNRGPQPLVSLLAASAPSSASVRIKLVRDMPTTRVSSQCIPTLLGARCVDSCAFRGTVTRGSARARRPCRVHPTAVRKRRQDSGSRKRKCVSPRKRAMLNHGNFLVCSLARATCPCQAPCSIHSRQFAASIGSHRVIPSAQSSDCPRRMPQRSWRRR